MSETLIGVAALRLLAPAGSSRTRAESGTVTLDSVPLSSFTVRTSPAMAVTVPETRLPGVGVLAAWTGAAQAGDNTGQLKPVSRTTARALPCIRFPGCIDMTFLLVFLGKT